MIEAVNAAAASAPLLRGNVEQVDAARALAANPERLQEAAPLPQAPYVSPYIYMDVNFDKAVLQIRDGDTGDVVRQFPSETTLATQARHSASTGEPAHFETLNVDVSAPQAPAPEAPAPQQAQANIAAAQAAAAALARGAQAALPQIATVVTSA